MNASTPVVPSDASEKETFSLLLVTVDDHTVPHPGTSLAFPPAEAVQGDQTRTSAARTFQKDKVLQFTANQSATAPSHIRKH